MINIGNKYNSVVHLYCSARPYIFSSVVLLFVTKNFLFCNSSIIFYCVRQLFQHRVFYHPIKSNETLPDVALPNMSMMNLTDLKQLNYPIQFIQWIQIDRHHSIQIIFDDQNWIISYLYNHADIKHNIFSPTFRYLTEFFATVMYSKNMHMWKIKCQFFNCWSVIYFMRL